MKITFGSATQMVNGRPPNLQKGEAPQMVAEKMILTSLLEQSINLFPEMEYLVKAKEAIGKVEKSNGSVELSGDEVKKIKETYKSLKSRPVQWVYYSDLFSQLVKG